MHPCCAVRPAGYEASNTAQRELFQPLVDFVKAKAGTGINGTVSLGRTWTPAAYDPTNPTFPWMEKHADREISTSLLASMSKYFPIDYLSNATGAAALAAALVNMTDHLPKDVPAKTVGVMFAKGQGGLPPAEVAMFRETAQNPVLLNTVGTLLVMYNVPALPQLPPSSKLLNKTLWPRLKEYVFTNPEDPVYKLCDSGAAGNEYDAKSCFKRWRERIPAIQQELDIVRDVLWNALPNIDPVTKKPFSGSYWCETDYEDRQFQLSHWGEEQYTKLLKIKQKYDPKGLFICHHCVGSEFWTAESNLNCPVKKLK